MTIPKIRTTIELTVVAVCLAELMCPGAEVRAQTIQAKTGTNRSYEIDMPATKEWLDTNIDLRGAAKLRFIATGKITYPADDSYTGKSRTSGTCGPNGLPRGWADLIHQYAVKDAGHGALIARIGSDEYGQAFLIGESKEYDVPVAGRLFVGLNQSMKEVETATGSFHVKIEILDEGSADDTNFGGPADTRVAGITPDLLSKIPRRASDPNGKPGDMVNVLIVGTQDQLVQAFATVGWVQVDKSVGNTVLNAVVQSLKKEDYLTMPMSTLFLFGRAQDYGFAHAEPVKVAMSRNHLRAWKSPYEIEGRPVWCIAATHDIGFERDQRNNGITHKIDPAIDGEREYVNGTLSGTGLVVQRDHVTPADPLTTAKTATGGEFHSDGRIVVLVLGSSKIAQRDQVTKGLGLGSQSALSDSRVALGLKEALRVGADNAVKLTGKTDGYFGNPAIKILLPKNLQPLEKGLGAIGYQSKIDAFVLSMNRAAEAAAPSAKKIFGDAILAMSFDDARKILSGGDTAATDYFKSKTSEQLAVAFRPFVEKTMKENSVAQQYEALTGELRSIPFVKSEDLDINKYVVSEALDGLFYMLGQEERKIRKNPAAQTTELLKEVFGKLHP